MAEEEIVDIGDQGRALASGRHVAFAKIGDDPQAGTLGHNGSLADLKCAGDAMSQVFDGFAFVKNGLPVQSAQEDRFHGYAATTARLPHRIRI